MKAVCDAMVHLTLVGMVVVLAGILDAAAMVVGLACAACNRLAGDPPRSRSGLRDLRAA